MWGVDVPAGVRSQSRSSHSSSVGIHSEQTSQTATSQPSSSSHPATSLYPGAPPALGHSMAVNTDPAHAQQQRRSLTDTAMSNDDLDSLHGDGVKLSLLVKAKAIEEQVRPPSAAVLCLCVYMYLH